MLGGNPTRANPAATSLLYTGERFDNDAQQYYLRARYYDTSTGRFNRMDPYAGKKSDPQSLHKYLYCHANPVNATDQNGMQGLLIEQLTVWQVIGMMITEVAPNLLIGAVVLGIAISISLVLKDVLPPILDAIAEGVEGAEQLYTVAVASAMAASAAKSKTLRKASRALGKTVEKLKKLKPYFVFEAATPKIYKFTTRCLLSNPTLYCLTWHANPARTSRNRAWIRRTYGYLRKPGYTIDEFPYASTKEGGWPLAKGYPVPWLENCAQGGYLRAFYYGVLRKPSKFIVVPVPK